MSVISDAVSMAATAAVPVNSSAEFFEQQRQLRAELVGAWRSQQKHSAAAHAAYALVRGKSLEKTFTPLKRPTKISNNAGGNPFIARDTAVSETKYAYASEKSTAWGWAHEVLEKWQISKTGPQKNRWDLTAHPVMGLWLSQAQEGEAAWRRA